MSIKIGSARIDENGNATGGKAGDQTGKEVSTQAWYKHAKGWRVFRAKSSEAAEKIAWDMQAACDNSHIGYDQNQRGTLYTAAKPYGFNCQKVTANVETDCSALVRVCCAYAGITLPDFNTSSEASVLLASGAFTELTGSKYTDASDYLRRGDVLVTKTKGHTAVVLDNGSKAEAATPAAPAAPTAPVGPAIRVTGASVYVRKGPGKDYGALGVAHVGDLLPYYGFAWPENGWRLVAFEGQTGWISGMYAELIA